MAVSTTTFEQRIQRIAQADAVNQAARPAKKRARKPRKSNVILPALFSLGVLTGGGAAYAFVVTGPDYQWLLSLAR